MSFLLNSTVSTCDHIFCLQSDSSRACRYARKPNYDLSYSTSCKVVGMVDDIAEVGKILDTEARNREALDERIQSFAILVTYISQVPSFTY